METTAHPPAAFIKDIAADSPNVRDMLSKMTLSSSEISTLQCDTVGQSSNSLWHRVREGRLTASVFYKVHTRMETIKKKPTENCEKYVVS